MIVAQVPELADGGYWYVLPALPVTEGDLPGWSYGSQFTGGACAWYAEIAGVMLVAVRTPAPVAGLPVASQARASTVLQGAGYSGRPYGRIGGR